MDRPLSLRVAVVGAPGGSADIDSNLAAADTAASAAATAGARILVLPQRFLTGGFASAAEARGIAILSDGDAARALADVARRHGMAIVCGYVEQCSGRFHDSALFIDGHGGALANYRRTHLVAGDEPEGLAPGHWLNLIRFGGHRFGLLLGADVEAPEPARALALAGAAALLVPAAHEAARAPAITAVLAARAFENGCGLAYANGHNGAGAPASSIIGSDGRTLAQAGDKLAVADLPLCRPPDAARRLAARRPQLYQKLAAPHPDGGDPRL